MSRATEPLPSSAGAGYGAAPTNSPINTPANASSTSVPGNGNGAIASSPESVRAGLASRHVCPFCGTAGAANAANQPCTRCTMEDTPVTRQATRSRIGPWYVLQTRNPAAPGMKFTTLLALVNKNQVTARSIVRGPTTHQLWRFAAHVRGLSREFGLCYSCGEPVDRNATHCSHCDRVQEPPANPDTLLETRDVPMSGVPATPALRPANQPNGRPISQEGGTLARQPQAYPPAPSTAARGGEHAERLRALNDGVASRARPALGNRDPRKVSGMDLASALQADQSLLQSDRRISFTKVVGVMLVLVLLGGGVFLYLNPPARDEAIVWTQEHWLMARDKMNSWSSQKQAEPDSAPIVESLPVPEVKTSPVKRPANNTASPPSVATNKTSARETPPGAVAEEPKKEMHPPEVSIGGGEAKPTAISAQTPVKQPTKLPEANITFSPPANPPTVDSSREVTEDSAEGIAAIGKGRELWGKALDARSDGKYADAIANFEAIKKLPSFAWPKGLQVQIDTVKKLMNQ